MTDDRTEAERRFDELVAARRAQGRKTYGRGLDHDDNFCWKMMALEEALDMGQYLMAHIVRLEQEIGHKASEPAAQPADWRSMGEYQLAKVAGMGCEVTYEAGRWYWKVGASGSNVSEMSAKTAAEMAARGER